MKRTSAAIFLWTVAVACAVTIPAEKVKEPARGKRFSDLPTVARSYGNTADRRIPPPAATSRVAVSSLYFDRGSLSRHQQNSRLTILHSGAARRTRPHLVPPPPYAVQMEPLVQYSQRDPLYHHQINKLKTTDQSSLNDLQQLKKTTLPTELPHKNQHLSESNELPTLSANTDDHNDVITIDHTARASLPALDNEPEAGRLFPHRTHPFHHRPVYIREPEPIIEIIVKESKETLPPPPTAPTHPPPPPTKEPVQVFYVKYKKESSKHGKESTVVYDPPIPALSPTVAEEHDEEISDRSQSKVEIEPPPSTPKPQTTTLRTIIRPDSEVYHGSGLHVTFGEPEDKQSHEEHLQQSAPQPSVVFPHQQQHQQQQQQQQQQQHQQPQQHFLGQNTPLNQRQDTIPFSNPPGRTFQHQAPILPRQSSFPPPQQPSGSQSFQRPPFLQQRPPQFQQRPSFPHEQPPPFRQLPPSSQKPIGVPNHQQFRQQPPLHFQQQQQGLPQRQTFQQNLQFQSAPQRLPFPPQLPQNGADLRKPSIPFQPNTASNFGEQQRPNFTPHPTQIQLSNQRQQQQFPNRPEQTLFSQNQPQQIFPSFANGEIIKSISQQLQPTNTPINAPQTEERNKFQRPQLVPQLQQQPHGVSLHQQQPQGVTLHQQQSQGISLHQQQFLNRQQNQQIPVNQRIVPQQQSFAVLPTLPTQTSNNTKNQHSFSLKSSTTTTPPPTTTTIASTTVTEENSVKPSVLAALPDEVPEDLRQQLLSSGILSNADIQVLDYDKVGDIPIESLPPEALENFYGAASDPVAVKVPAPSNSTVEMKVVHYDPTTAEGSKIPEQYVREDATAIDPVLLSDAKYNRYLPLKIKGAQFPLPDVPELRGRNITSVVVLAPVDYEFQDNFSEDESERLSRSAPVEVRGVQFVAGDVLKNVVKEPTAENFQRWLQKEKNTEAEKQSIVLLVAGSDADSNEKDIFMYDVTTQKVSRLRGELSSAFVEVAEANASSEELDSLAAASDVMETWLQGPYNVQVNTGASANGDLAVAASELDPQTVDEKANTISISSGYSKAVDFTGPSL